MLVLSAFAVGFVSFVWARRTKDMPLQGLILWTQFVSAAVTALLLIFMRIWPHSMIVICSVYILAELRGCFSSIQLAILLNENFNSRSEQKKFSLVNAGSPAAGIVVGTILGAEARVVAPTILMAFACLIDILSVLTIRTTTSGVRVVDSVRRLPAHDAPTVVLTSNESQPESFQHTRTFAHAILWMVICKTIVLAAVSFEWKVIASDVFPNDERALTAYFGYFYAITDGLTLLLQLFVTRYLLAWAGVPLCILLLPFYLTVLGILSLITQDFRILFLILTAARGAVVIRWGVHQVAVQILYGTLPRLVRRGTVARILGIAKPLAEAGTAGGIGILVFYLPVRTFAWFWMPVMMVWLWWTARIVAEWRRLNRRNFVRNAARKAMVTTLPDSKA